MKCPRCRKPYYFLEGLTLESEARCVRCGHIGAAEKPSYEDYHESLYAAKPYRRDRRTDPQMRKILDALKIKPGDVVIDLGCGVGDYTCAVREYTENAAGYDRDVRTAQHKYPGIRFFTHDLDQPLPLPDASADKVISINVIEHLADWKFFLAECARVLKPGGVLALSTANRDFLLHDLHYDLTHLHEWSKAEFEALTQGCFQTLISRKDCAMFNYYPLNLALRFFLKPDLTWIGRKF